MEAAPASRPASRCAYPLSTSPPNTFHHNPRLHRRTSSLSSNHDTSPTSPRRLSHRFSNISNLSGEFSPLNGSRISGGMGNLADELGELDDDDDTFDMGSPDGPPDESSIAEENDNDIIRDSGIDVSYAAKRTSPRTRNFSKPFNHIKAPEDDSALEPDLSPELEDALNSIARMTSYTSTIEDPTMSRTIDLLQDLGNQSGIESGAQRLNTSTNSLTAHLLAQTKSLQSLSTSIFSPFSFGMYINHEAAGEIVPMVDSLLEDLPLPDPQALQGFQKLGRENDLVVESLHLLIDTLQMGKQATNVAARHLRTTQAIVLDLRRERERADDAREDLMHGHMEQRIRDRACAAECRDILQGFESFCGSLRESLVG